MSTMHGTHTKVTVVLCCFIMLSTILVQATIDGWYQADANSGRGRNSKQDANEFSSDIIKRYDDMKLIPNSLVMPLYALNICGLLIEQPSGKQAVVCFGKEGYKTSSNLYIPQEYTLVDVLPVMDDNLGYFTVRRNSSTGASFVLRSCVTHLTNQVFFDTKTNNPISAMVLTEFGLIIASGTFLINVDAKTGVGNWIVSVDGIQNGCQFLYEPYYSTLYILHSNGIIAINPNTGMQYRSTQPGFQVHYSSQQSFLTVGKDLLAIPDIGFNRISIVDKNNLQRGVIASVNLIGRNGKFDLRRCSNIISIDTNSLFLVCKNVDASFSALRYDTTNSSISLGYEINTNSLFGIPPKVCSSQIAAFSKSGYYGIACDSGLIAFHQDNIFVPRREIHIDVAPETQVFGTLGRFALITSTDGRTHLEYVNIQ